MNILDLPNELLIIIFNKLNAVDSLYSLVDVNERFDEIVLEALHIQCLDTANMLKESSFDESAPVNQAILRKICEKILPRLHLQLNELVVDQNSLQHILFSNTYPQLSSLSLVNFQQKSLLRYLRDDSILRELLSEQITHLSIGFRFELAVEDLETSTNIFALILYLCQRLDSLSYCQLFSYQTIPVFIQISPSINVISSTLTALAINIKTFQCCLRILDGRFACLRTLRVHIERISHRFCNIDTTSLLPKLKYFSLISLKETWWYEKAIVPLIRRMINLEDLSLLFTLCTTSSTFIDGTQLHNDILMYLMQLKRFTFSIRTSICDDARKFRLPSNEDIQRSFKGNLYYQVGSYVDTESLYPTGSCHIYSLPYGFQYFPWLENRFPGGMFDKVRYLSMFGWSSFQLILFKRISESFACINELHIHNRGPQIVNEHDLTLIIFPHLMLLDLVYAHVDYAKQFLLHEKISVPSLTDLRITYESLVTVTDNFTNIVARSACSKIKTLQTDELFVR
ncbi:unnamed protein product, partial [Adineta ricciae]